MSYHSKYDTVTINPNSKFKIPNTAKTISLSYGTPIRIPPGLLPNSLTSLSLVDMKKDSFPDNKVCEYLQIGSIPNSVRKLKLDYHLIRHDPIGLIPESVRSITISNWIVEFKNTDTPTPIKLPTTVKKLKLKLTNRDEKFPKILYSDSPIVSEPLNIIPDTITELLIDYCFSLFIINFNAFIFMPQSLKKLSLQFEITKGMEIVFEMIPKSVEILILGPIRIPLTPGLLHNGIKVLDLKKSNCQIIKGSLPESLTSLSLGINVQLPKEFLKFIPPSVLHLSCYINKLVPDMIPPHVISLTFPLGISSTPRNVFPIPSNSLLGLPPSVERLSFGVGSNLLLQIGSIPHSVISLELGSPFNRELPLGTLPIQLESLTLPSTYNHSISSGGIFIPDTLKELNILPSYDLTSNLMVSKNIFKLVVELLSLAPKQNVRINFIGRKLQSFDGEFIYERDDDGLSELFIHKNDLPKYFKLNK
eukprot:gene3936-4912_t